MILEKWEENKILLRDNQLDLFSIEPVAVERWAWIYGYRGLYQISDQGRIKSFKADSKGRYIKAMYDKYNKKYKFDLYAIDGKKRTKRLHIEVFRAFKDYEAGKPIYFIDNDYHNIVASNLTQDLKEVRSMYKKGDF